MQFPPLVLPLGRETAPSEEYERLLDVALAELLADAPDTPIAVLRETLRVYADGLPEKFALLAE
ncbi:MAG TPA: hypothetical protein VE777_15865 [Gaiellales bacterium]|jgi:hypothetical protein|nr:hypothetical protein [Gaiellales bacterium]